jgi:hypothetical protein
MSRVCPTHIRVHQRDQPRVGAQRGYNLRRCHTPESVDRKVCDSEAARLEVATGFQHCHMLGHCGDDVALRSRLPPPTRLHDAWPQTHTEPPAVTALAPANSVPAHERTPFSAQLMASLPPDVNVTSLASHPSSIATLRRASLRAACGTAPYAWLDEGFPKCEVRNGTMAALTEGSIGVVPLLSR